MFVLLLDQDKKCSESSEFLSRLQLAAKELPLVGYPPCPAAWPDVFKHRYAVGCLACNC